MGADGSCCLAENRCFQGDCQDVKARKSRTKVNVSAVQRAVCLRSHCMNFSLQGKGVFYHAVSLWPMVLCGPGSAGAAKTLSRGRGGDAGGA